MLPNTITQITNKDGGTALNMYHPVLKDASVISVDEVTAGSTSAVYSCAGSENLLENFTDGVVRSGMYVTFASYSNASNNGTFKVLSIDDTADTITVDNASAVTETSASGTMVVDRAAVLQTALTPASTITDDDSNTLARVYDQEGYFLFKKTKGTNSVQVVKYTGTQVDVSISMSNDGVTWDSLPTAISANPVTSTSIYIFEDNNYPLGTWFRVQVAPTTTEQFYANYLGGY